MQSPYKTIIVYDLETGGLDHRMNSITEIALVAVDLETLEVKDTFSTIIQPNFNLEHRLEEPAKEARAIFKMIAEKDSETKIPVLQYRGSLRNIKEIDDIIEDISTMYGYIDNYGEIFNYEDILKMEKREDIGDVVKLYFDKTYNPQALSVAHMNRELLSTGVPLEEAIKRTHSFIESHTKGNNKPILAGHNIKSFDNPFFSKMLSRGGYDMVKLFSDTQMIDTLEWARLRWFEMPSYSLGVCANEVGLTLKEAHRALPDTIANANFLIEMLKDLRGERAQAAVYKKRKFNFNF